MRLDTILAMMSGVLAVVSLVWVGWMWYRSDKEMRDFE